MCFFDKYNALCKAKGKSANAVAKELGIPSSSVTNWKHGHRPRIDTIHKIADYFRVSVDFLTNEENPAQDMGGIYKDVVENIIGLPPEYVQRVAEYIEFLKSRGDQ